MAEPGRAPARLRRDHGSALMLMPAAVLIMVILGGLAVDSAVGFLAARELSDITAAAANDAAGEAIDDRSFYESGGDAGSGEVALLGHRAVEVATLAMLARGGEFFELGPGDVEVVVRGDEVTVRAETTVRMIFAPALPGIPNRRVITAESSAHARVSRLPAPWASASGGSPGG